MIGPIALPFLLALAPASAPNLIDVATLDDRFLLDIKYATPDNFFKKTVYPEARCILRREAAQKVLRAQKWLDAHHAGLRLMFKDCYRPNHVQHVLWNAVKGTSKARYVANPHSKTGSIHSYGAAVDLTLADKSGRELDMGTAYDFLGKLAEPRHEARFLKEGRLTAKQVKNRRILRDAMTKAGFRIIRNEWWHFNSEPASVVRKRFPRLDVPFSDVPRTEKN